MLSSALMGFIIAGILIFSSLFFIYISFRYKNQELIAIAIILGGLAALVGNNAIERQKELENMQFNIKK